MLLLNFSGFLWQPSNDMKCQPVKISLLTVNSLFKTWKNFINSFLCSTTNFAVSCYDFNSPWILASSFNWHSRWKQNILQLFMRSLSIYRNAYCILWDINVSNLQLKSFFLAWQSTVSSDSILISAAMISWNGVLARSMSILKNIIKISNIEMNMWVFLMKNEYIKLDKLSKICNETYIQDLNIPKVFPNVSMNCNISIMICSNTIIHNSGNSHSFLFMVDYIDMLFWCQIKTCCWNIERRWRK